MHLARTPETSTNPPALRRPSPQRSLAALCRLLVIGLGLLLATSHPVGAQEAREVIDLPTRPGITQRLLLQTPSQPRAVVILLAGGHGGLRLFPNGSMQWGEGNFLLRSRPLFLAQQLAVATVDAPSDRLSAPFLNGFRQSGDHVQDLKAVIGHLRSRLQLPVWLIGTSRGTQSAAHAATVLGPEDGLAGVVLTASILRDARSQALPAMALDKVRVPVLVVHHEQDACSVCPFSDMPLLMRKLEHLSRKALISVSGGQTRGDPCEAFAYHGFNGVEGDVVQGIAQWILAP